jgi:hypothetical protein
MADDSFHVTSDAEVNMKTKKTPSCATLKFIRQFARTCVTVQGVTLGSIIIN